MILKKLANRMDIEPSSLQKTLRRKKIFKDIEKETGYGSEDPLPEYVVNQFKDKLKESTHDVPGPKENTSKGNTQTRRKVNKEKPLFHQVLLKAPLPMLGLAMSYGVYHFEKMFMSWQFALIVCTALELVYIGLSLIETNSPQQKAKYERVSVFAVLTSIGYNFAYGIIFFFAGRNSELMEAYLVGLGWYWIIVLCLLHAIPLGALGFYFARLK